MGAGGVALVPLRASFRLRRKTAESDEMVSERGESVLSTKCIGYWVCRCLS